MSGTKRGKLKRCSGKVINKEEIVRCKNRCRVNKNIITAYCRACKNTSHPVKTTKKQTKKEEWFNNKKEDWYI